MEEKEKREVERRMERTKGMEEGTRGAETVGVGNKAETEAKKKKKKKSDRSRRQREGEKAGARERREQGNKIRFKERCCKKM